ncbi:MAG: pectin acetylesterase-family hydrolase, partial [Chloroflexota bacterium]
MGRGRTLGLVLVMGVTLLVFVTCGPRRRPGQAGRPTATPPALATVEATRPPQVEQVEPTAAPTMTAVSTMTAAPTLAADPTPAGGEAAGFPTLNNALSLMTLNAPDALCNDGSPARYYFRQGQNNKWLVFLEGGGACFDSAECDTRRQEQFNLTSSTRWEETMPLKGIFSNDPERNPGFWNWNQVYVKYCSSDAWSGKGLAADGRQFRGRAIIQGVLNDLERHPQFATGQGTDSAFILAGCSGGGQGVMQNLDDVALRLAGGFDDIRGINDAGWAIDVRPSYAGPDTPSFYDKLAKGFSYWSAGLDQS